LNIKFIFRVAGDRQLAVIQPVVPAIL